MKNPGYEKMAHFIREDLRLKTFPVAVKFADSVESFPEKAKRPSVTLEKR